MQIKDWLAEFKFVIVGSTGVGKSALLQRFTQNKFREEYITTIGVDFKFKTIDINYKKVKLQIWDTAGQEQFRSITSTYYRSSNAVFMVFDLTDKASFQMIKSYWIHEVENNTDRNNTLTVLVGNKADQSGRRVPKNDIQDLVTNKKTKTGKNVHEMFIEVATKIYEYKQVGKTAIILQGVKPQKIEQKTYAADRKKCQC